METGRQSSPSDESNTLPKLRVESFPENLAYTAERPTGQSKSEQSETLNRLRLPFGSPTSLISETILSERRKSHYAKAVTVATNVDSIVEATLKAAEQGVEKSAEVRRPARPLSTLTSVASPSSPNSSPTIQAIQRLLIDASNHASRLSSRLAESNDFLAKIAAVRDAFNLKKDDISFFCTSYASNLQDSTIVEVLDRALYELQASLFALDDQLQKADKFFPPASSKSKKLRLLTDNVSKNWTNLLMHLTLAMSTSSTFVAENASNNVAKLALANGHIDWEALDVDNAQLLVYAGDKFFLGHGVPKAYDLAIKRYEAAAPKNAAAANMLGVMLENGYGRSRDLAEAMHWYNKAAQQNNGDAYNNLGRIHENGIGCVANWTLARSYYEKSALACCLDGMVNFGLMLEQGLGCPGDEKNGERGDRDFEKAKYWYERAADSGYARAQNCLGNLYFKGLCCANKQPDYLRAMELFRRAANQGNVHAMNNLGILYESGLGVPKDSGVAKQLYKNSSEQGNHPSATNNYGWILLLERQYMEAFRTFHFASSQGSVDALHNIGLMYEHGCADGDGVVVRKDLELAGRYWRQAADKGYTKSITKFGRLMLGLDLSPEWQFLANPELGFKYLLHAAVAAQDPEAFYYVGKCKLIGLGTQLDLAGAKVWFVKAMENNHPEAFFEMALILFESRESHEQLEKAKAYCNQAIQLGSVNAQLLSAKLAGI